MEGRKRKRSSDVEKITLTGREQQMNALRVFLSSHMKKRKPGLLFITGPPGSGKSATVEAVLAERVRHKLQVFHGLYNLLQWLHEYNKAVINCMNIRPQQLYRHIAQKFGLSYREGEQSCHQAVKEFVRTRQDKM